MNNATRIAVRPEASSCIGTFIRRVERLVEETAPRARAVLTVKSGVRAGDVYMHNPRGSNNRLNAP